MDTTTTANPHAAGQAAKAARPARLNPFKYSIDSSTRHTDLYRSLDEVLLAYTDSDRIGLVPSGHAPWKPMLGRTETSPLSASLPAFAWQVKSVYTFRDGNGGAIERYIAEFSDPRDAFAFAELKQKHEDSRWTTIAPATHYYVTMAAWTDDGRKPEVARLRHDHFRKLRRRRDAQERQKNAA